MRTPAARWLLVLILLSTVAFAAEVFSDWGTNFNSNYTSLGEYNRVAKPFVPGVPSTVTALEVSAQGVTGEGAGRIVMELREDDNGQPGALMAFGTADAGFSGGSVRVEMIPTDVFIDGGSRYWAVFYAQQTDWVVWRHATSQSETTMESEDAGGGWTPFTQRRLTLRVHGTYLAGPVARDDEYFVAEDTLFMNFTPSVRANDTPDSGVTLTVLNTPGIGSLQMYANGTFGINNFDTNKFGDYTFQYLLDTGTFQSAPATVTIHVLPVNDAPLFNKGPDQFVAEDSSLINVVGWATRLDAGNFEERGQGLSFDPPTIGNPALFEQLPTVAMDGTLTFKPAPNQSGESDVTVRIRDDGGTANGGVEVSPTQTFKIFVAQVNDVPLFTPGPNVTSTNEKALVTILDWAVGISPGVGDPPQGLSFNVTTDKPEMFDAPPGVTVDGYLHFDPKADAGGFAIVTVMLEDDAAGTTGTPLSTAPHVMQIELTDPPPPADAGVIIIEQDASVIIIERPPDPPKLRGHYACSVAPEAAAALALVAFCAAMMRRRRAE